MNCLLPYNELLGSKPPSVWPCDLSVQAPQGATKLTKNWHSLHHDKHSFLMCAFFLPLQQVFGHDDYLQTALKCGDVVWKRGLLTKGYSICHGVAGNAYTLLVLYQLTGVSQKCSQFYGWRSPLSLWVEPISVGFFKFVLPCNACVCVCVYILCNCENGHYVTLVSTGPQTSSLGL